MASVNSNSHLSEGCTYPILQFKIMYWGPGEAGKTTNFQFLRTFFHSYLASKGFSIETTNHRTLWNDSVTFHFDIQTLKRTIIIQVATTTGQERFLATREYVLQNADGVIFVADSDPSKMSENKRSFEEVVAFTRESGIPILIQLNKRDRLDAIDENQFRQELGLPKKQYNEMKFIIPARANIGEGVQEIFMEMIEKILRGHFLGPNNH